MGDLTAADVMTFIVTADRERSKAFYRDILGFVLVREDMFACVFDLNGVALRVSAVEGFVAQQHTVLGWRVPDIAAQVRALTAKGIAFKRYEGFGQDELGIWDAPDGGGRVAWFADPDGNILSLAQLSG